MKNLKNDTYFEFGQKKIDATRSKNRLCYSSQ